MQKTMLLWDNAHYTQNDNHALNSWCFKEGGDSRTVAFVGKVENPWSETKTKHVPELLVKNRSNNIFFRLCMFRQRMLADNSITS